METGVIGVPFLVVVSLVDKGLILEPDFAIIQHILMEEQNALDPILIQLCAIIRNALSVIFCSGTQCMEPVGGRMRGKMFSRTDFAVKKKIQI